MSVSLGSKVGSFSQNEKMLTQKILKKARGIAPGRVESFDPETLTATVQPLIYGASTDNEGDISHEDLPLLVDVPVVFPHGGGISLTFPLQQGDECGIIFSDQCLDFWWQSGGIQKTTNERSHDLSDAFIIPGPFSQPNVLQNVSTDSVQLRTDDGKSFIELRQSGNVTVTSPHTTVNGPAIINGDLTVNGAIVASGDVTGADISLDNHVHPGVTSGDSETGAPQ